MLNAKVLLALTAFALIEKCVLGKAQGPDKFIAIAEKPAVNLVSNITNANISTSTGFFKGTFLNFFDVVINGLFFQKTSFLHY
jgi:hypothetical protein